MKLLITGGTGFVGTTLVPYLYERGYRDIALLVRSREKAGRKFKGLRLTLISTESADWTEDVASYAPNTVIHLAAYFTGCHDLQNVTALVNSNILFTTQLLEALCGTGCAAFINIGTFTEFADGDGEYLPANLYSASKTAVRPIIAYYQSVSHFKWINVIVYSPYGRKNDSKKVIDYLMEAVGSEEPVSFTEGIQVLDFIHVDDMADFFLTLLKKLPELSDDYYQFHLGTGEGHTVRKAGEIMEKVWGRKVNAAWGSREYSPYDLMHAVAPNQKNIKLLGWKAKLSLEDGIRILKEDVENHCTTVPTPPQKKIPTPHT